MSTEGERNISTYETYVSTPTERTVLLVRPRVETWTERVGLQEVFRLNFWRYVLIEFVLSLFFIMFACGSTFDNADRLHQGLSVGFLVTVLLSVSRENCGFFNPAISFGLLITRRLKYIRFILYFIAQIVGSLAGAGLLYLYSPTSFHRNLGAMELHEDVSEGTGFVVEMTLTFLLMWTVLSTTDTACNYTGFQSPLAIGFSVFVGMLTGIPFTGAAMNPIRAFGPGIIAYQLNNHWVYWVGPMVGALLAALSYEYVLRVKEEEEEVKPDMPRVQLHINTNHTSSTV